MKDLLGRALVICAVLFLLVYLGDYISIKFRIPSRPQFGTVHVQPYLAVPRKDGKTEFLLENPIDQPCVYSLFPHFSVQPCWYVERHKSKRINL